MVVVVDYGMGNLGSIVNMFKKIGVKAVTTSDPVVIERARYLVLPGVGAFDNGITQLSELGLIPILNDKVLQDRTPILGLCLGMQLFTCRSEEGHLPGLGWIDGETVRFRFASTQPAIKVPHMGWNTISVEQSNPILDDMFPDPRFYFVHSYHVVCHNATDVVATTCYGYPFVSIIAKKNIIGMQFHPEKSHKFGMKLFRNFVERF